MLNPLNYFDIFERNGAWNHQNITVKCSDLIGTRIFIDARITTFPNLGIAIVYFLGIMYTIWIYYNEGEFLLGIRSNCTLGYGE